MEEECGCRKPRLCVEVWRKSRDSVEELWREPVIVWKTIVDAGNPESVWMKSVEPGGSPVLCGGSLWTMLNRNGSRKPRDCVNE